MPIPKLKTHFGLDLCCILPEDLQSENKLEPNATLVHIKLALQICNAMACDFIIAAMVADVEKLDGCFHQQTVKAELQTCGCKPVADTVFALSLFK